MTCRVPGVACRQVPDLTVDADPDTGYTAYYRGAWRTVGGTRVSAPTIAALTALADASAACGGRPLGFLDPALYAAAAGAYTADYRDIGTGANSFAGVPGYAAGPGYDMASGLGAPTAGLGLALCHDAVSLLTPPAQRWGASRPVGLRLRAVSARGAALRWSASGLPRGLALGPAGRIAGTPTAAGRFTITVTAVDVDGATASTTFTAIVARGRPGHRRSTPTSPPIHAPTLKAGRSSADTVARAMNHRPELTIVASGASAEEAAAVVAALQRFLRDTAPAPVPERARRSLWLEASLQEGVACQPGLPPCWL